MTLDDLELLLPRILQIWEATTAKTMKIDPYCQRQNYSPQNALFCNVIYGFTLISLLGASILLGLSPLGSTLYNHNKAGKNGNFQPLYAKISHNSISNRLSNMLLLTINTKLYMVDLL